MRKVDVLRQLQEIDRQLDTAHVTQARISAEMGERSALDKREAEAKALRDRRHALETQQRDLELLAEQRRTKIQADEAKLYGGKVSNPKELGSLQDEVAQDKRQLNKVDDQLLEIMEQLEELGDQLTRTEAAFKRETDAWKGLQEQLKKQLGEAEAALSRLAGERSGVNNELTSAEQTTYETLKRQKGTAIAPVHQRTCQACRVGLTPSQEQRARQGHELIICHSCGRILHVPLT